MSISAFIVCCNEERHIRRCLESVRWCDEIIIIDSGSSDATLEICRQFNTRIIERPWPGFVAQKRFGLEQCTGDWVLNIDADEVVSAELALEIKAAVARDRCIKGGDISGYYLLRVVHYWGRFWRKGGWYPEYRLRLCKRLETTWGGKDPHEKAFVSGKTARLSGELHHYTYDDVSAQIRSLNSFSSTAAKSMWDAGERCSMLRLFANPVVRFLKFYLFKGGFREGLPGLLVAIIDSFYVFLKYVKLWEIGFHSGTSSGSPKKP